jgi:hypothetical protein
VPNPTIKPITVNPPPNSVASGLATRLTLQAITTATVVNTPTP